MKDHSLILLNIGYFDQMQPRGLTSWLIKHGSVHDADWVIWCDPPTETSLLFLADSFSAFVRC